MRQRSAFMFLDALTGLLLIGVLGGLLAATLVRHGRATQRLERDRAAVRLAEETLLTQAAAPPPGVTVRRLPATAPAGFTWAEVTATVQGRPATLVGLVPAGKETP